MTNNNVKNPGQVSRIILRKTILHKKLLV